MKILALNHGFDCQRQNKQKENINFSSLWAKAQDLKTIHRNFSGAVDVTDTATYNEYLPALGRKIIDSLQPIREALHKKMGLGPALESDQLPHLFLHSHQHGEFFAALDAAVIEIGASPLPAETPIKEIIEANFHQNGTRCKELRGLVMSYVANVKGTSL